MRFSIVCQIILFIIAQSTFSILLKDEFKFKCEPKPGCNFSQCDPLPNYLLEIEGIDIVEYRRRNDYHIICQPNLELMEDAFSESGKRYEDMEQRLAENEKQLLKMKKKIKFQSEKMELLTALVNSLIFNTPTTETFVEQQGSTISNEDKCTIYHADKCFRPILSEGQDVDYQAATKICQNMNSFPANLYSQSNFDDVMNHIRTLMPSQWDLVYLWLGMKIEQPKSLKLYDGTNSTFANWYPGDPRSKAQLTHVALQVYADGRDLNQGMWNTNPSKILHGVVCEFQIE